MNVSGMASLTWNGLIWMILQWVRVIIAWSNGETGHFAIVIYNDNNGKHYDNRISCNDNNNIHNGDNW